MSLEDPYVVVIHRHKADLAPVGFIAKRSMLRGAPTAEADGRVLPISEHLTLFKVFGGETRDEDGKRISFAETEGFKLPVVGSFAEAREHNERLELSADVDALRKRVEETERKSGSKSGSKTSKPKPAPYRSRHGFAEADEARVAARKAKQAAELDELLEEMDAMIGLTSVKKHIRMLVNFQRVMERRRAAGLPLPTVSHHLAFEGAPGTGKTTIARLVARLYHALGVTATPNLVETDRSGLVGSHIGETAQKTLAQLNRARGGVLFIDEAYALASDDGRGIDYGREAIATLLKVMEDDRANTVVIFAGYSKEMERLWASNSGLKSRVPDRNKIVFPSYEPEELLEIATVLAEQSGYSLSDAAQETLLHRAHRVVKDDKFGNGRWSRDLVENAILNQAGRIIEEDGALDEIHSSDFDFADEDEEIVLRDPDREPLVDDSVR